MNNKSKNKWYGWIALLFAFILVIGSIVPVSADTFDSTKKGSVTINLAGKDGDDYVPITGATLYLYKVATITETNGQLGYQLTSSFDSVSSSLDNIQDQTLIDELENIAVNLDPTYAGDTDENGVFYLSNVEPGLYLVVQPEAEDGFYAISPYLFSLPYTDENGDLVYDVDASPKTEPEKIPETPYASTTVAVDGWKSYTDASRTTTKTAVHVVDTIHYYNLETGETYTAVAQLMDATDSDNVVVVSNAYAVEDFTVESEDGSGEVEVDFGTVSGLEYNHNYVVYETIYKGSSDNYDASTVIAEHKDSSDAAQTFKVREDFPSTDDETPTPTPTPRTPTTPKNPSTPTGHVTMIEKTTGTLPQTGQLWWPVPILCAAGAGLIIVGMLMRKKNK